MVLLDLEKKSDGKQKGKEDGNGTLRILLVKAMYDLQQEGGVKNLRGAWMFYENLSPNLMVT